MNKSEIIGLLQSEGEEKKSLFERSNTIKKEHVGNIVYFRGLIEMSNICAKNCLYCGIRSDNNEVSRYSITDDEILSAVKFAYDHNYASIVLQGGEVVGEAFSKRIENLLLQIKHFTHNEIGVTLSLGEQSDETYQRWFSAGSHRYLLRMESFNPALYTRIHPDNDKHSFVTRLNCLYSLKKIGYQVGTGVMIGLPFQTMEDLANDLLSMQQLDIDMCGMGPFLEHKETPLYEYRHLLLPKEERFDLSLKMIAVLRILMPDINIAAATALQAIDPMGREKAIKVGANIVMPNITPGKYRDSYKLYENKPCTDEEADECTSCLEARVGLTGNEIGYGSWGDSKHFLNRKEK